MIQQKMPVREGLVEDEGGKLDGPIGHPNGGEGRRTLVCVVVDLRVGHLLRQLREALLLALQHRDEAVDRPSPLLHLCLWGRVRMRGRSAR